MLFSGCRVVMVVTAWCNMNRGGSSLVRTAEFGLFVVCDSGRIHLCLSLDLRWF